MARGRREGPLELLLAAPWWVGVITAGLACVAAGVILPVFFSGHAFTAPWADPLRQAAPFVALTFLLPPAWGAVRGYRAGRQLARERDARTAHALSWLEFEKLALETFERIGYSVCEAGVSRPDGGMDLVASAPDEKLLVQCRHWRGRTVGAGAVRELLRVMKSEGATGGALVTTGTFSQDAIAFASGKPIQLIDAPTLEQLASSVFKEAPATEAVLEPEPPITIRCPDCGSPMIARNAKRGRLAGETFWGCSRYPVCSGTRAVASL